MSGFTTRGKAFTVTNDHLLLARRMYVSWSDCEYGAPEIDPKRPYGNSDVPGDIADILGWENRYDPKTGEPLREWHDRAAAIHKEMQTALQVFLATGAFEAGIYRAGEYGQDWKRVA